MICDNLEKITCALCKIMRSNVDKQKIEQLMKVLDREARLVVDIDIRLDPEPPGIFQAIRLWRQASLIAELKQRLDINIELADPQDFLPPLPGWRSRSIFIGRFGGIEFYHYDFISQAISKLSRGYNRDIDDVRAMYQQKLFSLQELRDCFDAIEAELIRFPSLNPDILKSSIEQFIEHTENTPGSDK